MAETKETKKAPKNQEMLDLYAYIEKEILGYDSNQKLQKQACLRIIGMKKGKLIANNKTADLANYTPEIIMLTFKAYRQEIVDAMRGKKFTSEFNQVAYACAIVESHINDIYMRLKNAKKSAEKTEAVVVSSMEYDGAEYKSQTETTMDEKFEELW